MTQWYAPEPVSQPGWIVDALRRAGADVNVLTGIPNYPSGKVQSGFRWWHRGTRIVDGVAVTRTPLIPSHSTSALGRISNYLSWALSASLLGGKASSGADVCLVYSSPATAALPAMAAKWRRGLPYVLLVQDVWPDSVFSSGFIGGRCRRVVAWALTRFVSASYRHAAHVLVISPGMADLLEGRGVPREKISVVYNWVDESPLTSSDHTLREDLGIGARDLLVMYAGNHGAAQSLGPVIEAFGLLGPDSHCHLVLVGDGVTKPKLKEVAAPYSNVHLFDSQPRERMATLMAAADVQLVSLLDLPLFAVTIPSKLQAALASGSPVLAVARGSVADLVESAGAGVAAQPGDVVAIADAVRALAGRERSDLSDMGARAKELYVTEMAEAVGGRRLVDALSRAAKGREASVLGAESA